MRPKLTRRIAGCAPEEDTRIIKRLRKKIRDKDQRLRRLDPTLRLEDAERYGPLTLPKLDTLNFAFHRLRASSLADLGAAYRVDGGYSFYALDSCGAARAVLVDAYPTKRMLTEAASRERAEVVWGNFGDTKVAERIGEVDVVVLFDVLLHQVSPDWDELLELYAPRTRLFAVHNPQWLGPETIRLPDLGEENYLAIIPKTRNETLYRAAFERPDEIAPEHGRPNRDVFHLWQWGITDSDLFTRMHSLGFALRYFQDHDYFWGLEHFRNRSFIFEKGA
jgi:hypothetical protein